MPSDVEHVLVGVRLEGIQVEEEVVGVPDGLARRVERMHLDRTQVGDEQQRRQVIDGEVVDLSGLRVLGIDRAPVDPVRRVHRCRLLVEGVPRDAVGHPLHRERPPLEVW